MSTSVASTVLLMPSHPWQLPKIGALGYLTRSGLDALKLTGTHEDVRENAGFYMHQLQLVGGPIINDKRIVLSDELPYRWFRNRPKR